MALVIKRRVSLDFLGDEYKDAYIEFRAIPTADFTELQKEIDKLDDEGNDKSKEVQNSTQFILDVLKKYFYSGKDQDGADIKAEDLNVLDPVSTIKCFEGLTGQVTDGEGNALDPKEETPSTKPSGTDNSTGK